MPCGLYLFHLLTFHCHLQSIHHVYIYLGVYTVSVCTYIAVLEVFESCLGEPTGPACDLVQHVPRDPALQH